MMAEKRFKLFQFEYSRHAELYSVVLWIFVAIVARTVFQSFHRLSKRLPESCSMMIIGLIVGTALDFARITPTKSYSFDADMFFMVLLPPIMLQSGYLLPLRAFVDNLGTILLFAIVNTMFNTLAIGFTLYAFNWTPMYGGVKCDMLHCLLFASFISAVDPVAILATFEDIQVNETLHIIVFGESLRVFSRFCEIGQANVVTMDIVLGVCSFFVNAIGGILFGLIFGFLGSLITKYMGKVTIIEPLVIMTAAYLSYLTAEIFMVSGIIAMTISAVILRQYVVHNICKESEITTEYCIKMMSTLTESVIFLLMGLSAINSLKGWNFGFTLVTAWSCVIYRAIGVAVFGAIANKFRVNELSFIDMIIMSYGGLRGAVAFALALILNPAVVPSKDMLLSTTVVIIYITVFLQGITMRPIVKALKVRRKHAEEPAMVAKLSNRVIDKVIMIIGSLTESGLSSSGARWVEKLSNVDEKFIRPVMCRDHVGGHDRELITNIHRFIAAQGSSKPPELQNAAIQVHESTVTSETAIEMVEEPGTMYRNKSGMQGLQAILDTAIDITDRRILQFDAGSIRRLTVPFYEASLISELTRQRISVDSNSAPDDDRNSIRKP